MKHILQLFAINVFILIFMGSGCSPDNVTTTVNSDQNTGKDSTVTDTTRTDTTDNSDNPDNSSQSDWLIPKDKVVDGGPGKDGIPSIDNPKFKQANFIEFMNPEELVIGIKVGDKIRAYPHKILDYHEIVNDAYKDTAFCMTYCPLTGTAIAWNREINGEVTEFGVSGLLYKNNLIPYDRNTDSNWSQMLNLSVNGENKGTESQTLNIIETKWSTWKSSYPNSRVLTRETGYSRNYDNYPYGNYKENNDYFLFPVENKDDRLPAKDRVHGIEINDSYVVFPFSKFGDNITVVNTEINGKKVVVFGSKKDNIIESYFRSFGGTEIKFQAVQDEYPIVMQDQTGTKWNIFGEAVSGSRKGVKLKSTQSYNGFWFAFADFFPGVPILNPNKVTSIPEY